MIIKPLENNCICINYVYCEEENTQGCLDLNASMSKSSLKYLNLDDDPFNS